MLTFKVYIFKILSVFYSFRVFFQYRTIGDGIVSDLGSKKIIARNIKYYIKQKGVSRTDICRALKFPYSTFTQWVNAEKYPRIDKIEMMANYFHISKSDLIENKETRPSVIDERAIGVPGGNEIIKNILLKIKDLPEDDRKATLELMYSLAVPATGRKRDE